MDPSINNSGQSDLEQELVDDSIARVTVKFVRKDGWLAKYLGKPLPLPTLPVFDLIEEIARITNDVGHRPLWAGYKKVANYSRRTGTTRTPNQVRIRPITGRFFSWLAGVRENPQVIEIGTAFGISSMYWLSGIGNGHLYTFDPNPDWTELARENLARIAPRFTITVDTFDEAGQRVIGPTLADIAFIDAIHTSEAVNHQLEILKPMMKAGGLILFDDIAFSDDMRACWIEIANSPLFVASGTLGRRTGIVESR